LSKQPSSITLPYGPKHVIIIVDEFAEEHFRDMLDDLQWKFRAGGHNFISE
jgi:hypothetical protein